MPKNIDAEGFSAQAHYLSNNTNNTAVYWKTLFGVDLKEPLVVVVFSSNRTELDRLTTAEDVQKSSLRYDPSLSVSERGWFPVDPTDMWREDVSTSAGSKDKISFVLDRNRTIHLLDPDYEL